MTTHGKDMNISLAARWPCFTYNYTTDTYERKASGSCSEATINQTTGVQTGGPPRTKKRSQSFAFYLPYELGFVKDFTVDAENHPRGCNIPDDYPQKEVDGKKAVKKWQKTAINCTRSTFTLEGEDMTSADIVDQFADDHEVWAHAFIEGWQVAKANSHSPLSKHSDIVYNVLYCCAQGDSEERLR